MIRSPSRLCKMPLPRATGTIRLGYDEEGLPSRPATFHASKEQLDLGSSSIDGLLMNTTALMCLDTIHVADFQNKCHLPVHATFKWSRLHQSGWIWKHPAALSLSDIQKPIHDDLLCPHQQNALNLWSHQYAPADPGSTDAEDWLSRLNDMATDTLLLGGAKWLPGRRERGQRPRFRKATLYKGQLSNGDAATVELRWLHETLSMTIEAIFRQSRSST